MKIVEFNQGTPSHGWEVVYAPARSHYFYERSGWTEQLIKELEDFVSRFYNI